MSRDLNHDHGREIPEHEMVMLAKDIQSRKRLKSKRHNLLLWQRRQSAVLRSMPQPSLALVQVLARVQERIGAEALARFEAAERE